MNEKVKEFKQIAEIKDKYSVKRDKERTKYSILRFSQSKELIDLRDKVSVKRFGERVKLFEMREIV